MSTPSDLKLVDIAVPVTQQHVIAGNRVFVTSVEFWTTFTGIRIMWPVRPSFGLEGYWPFAIKTSAGITTCSRWSVGAIRSHSDMYVTTDAPLPLHSRQFTMLLSFGALVVDLPTHAPTGT